MCRNDPLIGFVAIGGAVLAEIELPAVDADDGLSRALVEAVGRNFFGAARQDATPAEAHSSVVHYGKMRLLSRTADPGRYPKSRLRPNLNQWAVQDSNL